MRIGKILLTSHVSTDSATDAVSAKFDYPFTGEVTTVINVPTFPEEFDIGLIVGSSGSGKSTILRECFGEEEVLLWDDTKAIISQFPCADEGVDKLSAVGLGSIPSWVKPYNALSTGEKFRADLARRLHSGAVIDEFTSVVNRETAKACSYSVQKYIRNNNIRRVVFASCHDDITDYLLPDWVYNTDTGMLTSGRCLQRPKIELLLEKCDVRAWEMFKKHHYLSGDINKACTCEVAILNGYAVAFVASLAFPFKGCHNAWRESRLVVLPDFQGIGIGNAVSEAFAQQHLDKGYRYFSKTANPRCGIHRDRSKLWRPTSHNHKKRPDYMKDGKVRTENKYTMTCAQQIMHAGRVCYSHEYVGEQRGANR